MQAAFSPIRCTCGFKRMVWTGLFPLDNAARETGRERANATQCEYYVHIIQRYSRIRANMLIPPWFTNWYEIIAAEVSIHMLMLGSGQAQGCQVIEVSGAYLVYLNYFYPDWGHSAIYSSHYSWVIFFRSKVSPCPCSLAANMNCKLN